MSLFDRVKKLEQKLRADRRADDGPWQLVRVVIANGAAGRDELQALELLRQHIGSESSGLVPVPPEIAAELPDSNSIGFEELVTLIEKQLNTESPAALRRRARDVRAANGGHVQREDARQSGIKGRNPYGDDDDDECDE